jgi:hypothetical protein
MSPGRIASIAEDTHDAVRAEAVPGIPGRRDEWVRFMDGVIIPFQAAKGMTIVGTFLAEEDPDLHV